MTTEQAIVSLVAGGVLALLFEAALVYERWRSKTWRLEDNDMIESPLWTQRRKGDGR